jgi:branched-chain amino acid transport system permease protein
VCTQPASRIRAGVAFPIGRWIAAAVVVAILIGFPFVMSSGSTQNVAILVFLYAALAQAWNILGGYAGQISLGNAAFVGIGAYCSTVMLVNWNISPWIGMLVGAVLASIFAIVVGYPMFRLGGHYFAIATIALAEILLIMIANWNYVGGAVGLSVPFVRGPDRRPADSWTFLQFNSSRVPYYFIALGLAVVATIAVLAVDRSKLGYYFRAIRNDQAAARSLGVHVVKYKLIAIVISAALTAIAGSFYAQYLLFIDPDTTMRLDLSVLIALVAILGGVGTVAGPLVGAVVMIPLSEYARSYLGGGGGALDLVLYGALIVIISVFEPNGLIAIWRKFSGKRTRPAHETATDLEEEAKEEVPLIGGIGPDRS